MPGMLWSSHRARAEIMASLDTRAAEASDRAMMPAPRPLWTWQAGREQHGSLAV